MAKLSAFAVVADVAGRILFCHRADSDLWNLPGGAVEPAESPWDAVVREVREEVCLDVEVTRLAGVYFKPTHDEASFLFDCRVVGGIPGLTDETDRFDWFAPDAIPSPVAERQKERVLDSLRHAGKTVLASQDVAWADRRAREAGSVIVMDVATGAA
jgi:8-oxo-dGTP diphosphatase